LRGVRALATLRRGMAAFKACVAGEATPSLAHLPWDEDVLSLLREERARGRRIYLASAADRRLVETVACHFGLFDGVFCSDGTVNLSARARTRALRRAFGEGRFDYVSSGDVADRVPGKARSYLRAIRIHSG